MRYRLHTYSVFTQEHSGKLKETDLVVARSHGILDLVLYTLHNHHDDQIAEEDLAQQVLLKLIYRRFVFSPSITVQLSIGHRNVCIALI